MTIDATFWVAISFIIFFAGLIYLKVPKKINELFNKLILDIKNEIDESEKLRTEAKVLLDNSQKKLDSAQSESKKILVEQKIFSGFKGLNTFKKSELETQKAKLSLKNKAT